jgi:hypothetical protein
VFSGKTYNLDIHESGYTYSLDLKDVTVAKITGPNVRKFEQIDDKTMKITLSELDLNLSVDAELTALKFIPFVASAVDLKNVAIEFTVESTSDDQVHWALKDSSVVTLGDFEIHMSNSFLNTLVRWSHSIVAKIINGQIGAIGTLIDNEIQILNKKVTDETAQSFEVNLLGKSYPLNMTMTKAPEVDGDIVKINFDGLFDEPANYHGFAMDSHDYFPDVDAQKEQVWFHENTANTLLKDAIAAGYTIDFDAADLMPAFKEVTDAYPNATNFTTKTTISPINEGTPVRFTKANGIMIGNDKDLKLTMDLYADDAKVVTIGVEAMFNMNFVMDQHITFFPNFKDVRTFSAMVKTS